MTTTEYFCDHAWLGGDEVAADVLIRSDDGVITQISRGQTPPSGATYLHGVVLPGAANTHSHAFHRALRGRGEGPGSFWSWRDTMYAIASRLEPDLYYRLARAVYIEMVLSGFTAVGEFHYLHHRTGGDPYVDPNAMSEALIAAGADAGIRLTLLDTCYLAAAPTSPLEPVQMRFSDGDAERWAQRAESRSEREGLRLGAAIHSARAVPPAAMEVVAKCAAANGWVLHAHLSEQPQENEQVLAAYATTPTGTLRDSGALGARTTLVHATHVTNQDIATIASSSSGICLCPTTERALADGIGPAGRFASAGIALSIGSDAHAVIDPLEECRAVELDERLATYRRGTFSAGELLEMATRAGHRAIGWDGGGVIEVGAPCDLAAYDLSDPAMAGFDERSILSMLVYAGTRRDVREVVISGRRVVCDGVHVREPTASRELASAISQLVSDR